MWNDGFLDGWLVAGLALLAGSFLVGRACWLQWGCGRHSSTTPRTTAVDSAAGPSIADPAVRLDSDEQRDAACREMDELSLEVDDEPPLPTLQSRITRRMDVLDDLILEADREIEHLSDLLADVRGQWPDATLRGDSIQALRAVGTASAASQPPEIPFSRRQCAMFRTLSQAGYGADEIANLVRCPPEQIVAALSDDPQGFGQRRAG